MVQSEMVGIWPMIPHNAFLYFPANEEIKIGSEEKQWRKIFEGGVQYDSFQVNALQELQTALQKQRLTIDAWFTRANKLRYLQANKFKLEKTINSIVESTAWRQKQFPVDLDANILRILNSGAFYFCGRDNCFRPIIVADISRFNPEDVDLIPSTLVIMMEYMIGNLLIQGQVENYVLIMDLKEYRFGLNSVVFKIISFTSNSYRGRLFVSYLLSMPFAIYYGWNGLISNFVSQNTLRKIKTARDNSIPQMWEHTSRQIIQQRFRGDLPDQVAQSLWLPDRRTMLFVDPASTVSLVNEQQYRQWYQEGRLKERKILRALVTEATRTLPHYGEVDSVFLNIKDAPLVSANYTKQGDKHREPKSTGRLGQYSQDEPSRRSREDRFREFKGEDRMQELGDISSDLKTYIMVESSFIQQMRSITPFFSKPSFRKICAAVY